MGKAKLKNRRARRAAREAVAGDIKVGSNGKCQSRKQNGGGLCARPAGWGTSHPGYGACKLHGGSMPNQVKHAQVVQATEAVETYGLPREVAPMDALLEELQRTAGHVAWLGGVVQGLEQGQLVGLVGEAGRDERTGTVHHPSTEASIWLKLYQAERKHMTDVASTCIKCGIAERQVKLAEQQGQLLAQVIQAILSDLKVPPAKARPVVRKHLTAIAGGAAG